MSEHYHVRVGGDDLVFSAAHFITYGDGPCERLHGHNYRVAVELSGPLGAGEYVVDFVALKRLVRAILDELDHRVILPEGHPRIRVTAEGREVTATFDDRRWVLPRGDCVILPLANTTVELVARWLAGRLREEVQAALGVRPQRLRVEIEECAGQSAVYEWVEGSG